MGGQLTIDRPLLGPAAADGHDSGEPGGTESADRACGVHPVRDRPRVHGPTLVTPSRLLRSVTRSHIDVRAGTPTAVGVPASELVCELQPCGCGLLQPP